MKKTAILISILLISAAAFSQRVIPVAKRTFPIVKNQITKQDSLSDEFGLEYVDRPFQGVEEDTAAINADFLRREKLKEGKITDPEREIVEIDYDYIFYTDMKDFEKAEAERKKSQKAAPANKK